MGAVAWSLRPTLRFPSPFIGRVEDENFRSIITPAAIPVVSMVVVVTAPSVWVVAPTIVISWNNVRCAGEYLRRGRGNWKGLCGRGGGYANQRCDCNRRGGSHHFILHHFRFCRIWSCGRPIPG